MRHQESIIQQTCVRWFRMKYPQLALLLFAVPNGGARLRSEAAIMKAEGTMKGVADLLLLFPAKRFHGLCIEMKTPTGRPAIAKGMAGAGGMGRIQVCHLPLF